MYPKPEQMPDSRTVPGFAILLIFAIGLASCDTGPVAPGPPSFSLSETALVFAGPNAQDQVTISNVGSETLEWRILSSTASWLKADPIAGTVLPRETGVLNVKIDRAAVASGTHTGTLEFGGDGRSVTIEVTVHGFSPPVAQIAPQAVSIGPQESSETVVVSNSGGATLDWNLAAPEWVTLNPTGGSLPAGGKTNVIVTPRRDLLTTGEHQGSLQLASNGGTVNASLSVAVPAISDLVFQPAVLNFGADGSKLSLTIRNGGQRSVDWEAQPGSGWLRLFPSKGLLPPGMSQSLTVEISRSGLLPGTHSTPIHFTANGVFSFLPAEAAVIPAGTQDPSGSAQLQISPVAFDFQNSETEAPFRIHNRGQIALDWVGSTSVGWAAISAKSGHIPPDGFQDVTLRVSRAGLSAAGTYRGLVQISSNGGSGTVLYTMELSATPPSPPPAGGISVTPLILDFGSSQSELMLRLRNMGDSELTWSGSTEATWATLTTGSGRIPPGATQEVVVRASRAGVGPDETLHGVLRVSSSGSKVDVSMSLEGSSSTLPSSPRLAVTPSSLQFGLTRSELAVSVQNAGGGTLTWSATDSVGWLTLAKQSGSLQGGSSEQVVVRVSRAGLLSAGTYEANLRFVSNGNSLVVPVSLQVPESPPRISASPTSLDFGTSLGSLKLLIQNTGGSSLNWSASPTVGWTSLSASSGVVQSGGAEEIDILVARSALLSAGTYRGQIQLSSNGGNLSVDVSLQVQAPPSSGSGTTVDVRTFGAKGDGVNDDAPAFRAAIEAVKAAGGTVSVPPGNYRLSAIHIGPYRPIDFTKISNITIAGSGMDNTFLEMAPGQYTGAANVFLIFKAANITIKDLTVDMNASQSTFLDEQSHAMRIVSSTGIRIQGVRFQDSPGDGIYLLGVGEPGEPWTEQVTIENSQFMDLDRNGISVQRGVRELKIRGNTFERLADQSISAEPSGSGDISPRAILIENNTIRHSSSTYAVALGGAKRDDLLYDITFRGNHLQAASAYFTRVVGLVVQGNTFIGDRWHPPLRMEFVTGGVAENNTVTGVQTNAVEGILQVINEESYLTSNMTVRNNTLHVNDGSTGIYVRDAGDGITVTGNLIFGSNSKAGIFVETLLSLGVSRKRLDIVENRVQNVKYGVVISTRGDPFSQMGIRGNYFEHNQQPPTATIGILFSGTGAYQNFAEISSNTFGPGIAKPIVLE